MHVISDHSLLEHVQNTFGQLLEAGLRKCPYHVDSRDPALHHVVRRKKVRCHVTFQGIVASMGIGYGFHLLIRHLSKPQVSEDGLNRLSGKSADTDDFLFRHGPEPAVHLHVPLQDIVIVKVLRIKIRSGEHIIVIGFCRISRENKIRAGHELQHGSCRSSHVRV